MRKLLSRLLPPVVPFVVVVLGWEFIIRAGWIAEFILPKPSSVCAALVKDTPELLHATGETALASVIGLALSSVIGITLAILLSIGGWVQRAFYPYAVLFQTVPIVAIAPLLVFWLDIDIRAVIASAFIVSVFPVIANTLSGLLSVDPALRDLFRLYGASGRASLLKLRLPFALPNILTGLRIAAGLAVIGAIVGEFITGGGIGGLIDVSRQQRRLDMVFALLLLAALLGIALFGIINSASYFALRHWHASEQRD